MCLATLFPVYPKAMHELATEQDLECRAGTFDAFISTRPGASKEKVGDSGVRMPRPGRGESNFPALKDAAQAGNCHAMLMMGITTTT